jgi:hypothetical protein
MVWKSISGEIDRVLRHAPAAPTGSDLRTTAGALAALTYGMDTVLEMPALVNIAALAWLTRERRVVHRISSGAAHVVHDTDLRTIPSAPPPLLHRPWILTSRNPERGECLFGDTAELAGYPLDDRIYLIGLQYPDGIKVAGWRPKWSADEIEIGLHGTADLIDDVDAWQDWARDAARFALMLGILLDAESTPVVLDSDTERSRAQGGSSHSHQSKGTSAWSVRRVYVDARIYRPSSQTSSGEAMGKRDDLVPTRSMVSGHLKRQPYGPGRSLRKWVYVHAYEARRWTMPNHSTRIDVQTYNK